MAKRVASKASAKSHRASAARWACSTRRGRPRAGGAGNAGGGGISDAWLPASVFSFASQSSKRALTRLQLREVVLNLAQDSLALSELTLQDPTTPDSGDSLPSPRFDPRPASSAASICARIDASIAVCAYARPRSGIAALLARDLGSRGGEDSRAGPHRPPSSRFCAFARACSLTLRQSSLMRSSSASTSMRLTGSTYRIKCGSRPASIASVVPAGISIAIGVRSR